MARPIPCSKAWPADVFPLQEIWTRFREWITNGKNGLLIDATDPQKLADAILEGLENKTLRGQAAGLNQKIIAERAEFGSTMKRVEEFYQKIKRKI